MKVLFKTLFVVLVLGVLRTSAQDTGNPDTLSVEITVSPTGTTRLVTVELWGYLDGTNWSSVGSGFRWEPAEMVLDSGKFSTPAFSAFDFIRQVYRGQDIAQSNQFKNFIFAGTRLASAGLAVSPNRQLLGTWYFTLTSASQLVDSIVIDTNAYNAGALYKCTVVPTTPITPRWGGRKAVQNPLDVTSNGDGAVPTTFSLDQNYPNPFNPKTKINFSLPKSGEVTLSVFNVLGQSINNLVDQEMAAGNYSVEWDGRDKNGRPVASGVYFYRLVAESFVQTRKMMLLK